MPALLQKKTTNQNSFRVLRNNTADHIDRMMAIGLLGILVAGSAAVYSASSQYGLAESGSAGVYFFSHVKRIFIGLIAFLITMKIDYRVWKTIAGPAALVGVCVLAYTLTQRPINNAQRWVHLGGLRFQPIEPVKYAVLFYLASKLSEISDFKKDVKTSFSSLFLIFACIVILVMQPNYSMAAVLLAVTGLVLFLARMPISWLVFAGSSVAAAATVVLFAQPYRAIRVVNWVNAAFTASPIERQLSQSYIAFGRGGLWGQGLGESMQKLFYLSEPFNDFIFSIFGEEWGLVGCSILVSLYALVFIRGLNIIRRARDEFARLLAVTIVGLFVSHTLVNMFVTTGLMPVTGQPLPLFSYGGTAIIMTMAALGILMNISYSSRNLDPGRP
jgi:cell division protein FtsW